ncbi:hypothetical protein PH586_19515 [Pseudomonas sp. SA3-5]|uniref:Uncharacterized protein n=1 Tax=Pseudomonas aestuarii TaxID=3018340 RepID=A0ABT4XK40_9PSED|nr:hypothetical protein [Pseudomonas aestuarii]MDA7088574.1 hypothetical protein [Pseudomonas aestuarii]
MINGVVEKAALGAAGRPAVAVIGTNSRLNLNRLLNIAWFDSLGWYVAHNLNLSSRTVRIRLRLWRVVWQGAAYADFASVLALLFGPAKALNCVFSWRETQV